MTEVSLTIKCSNADKTTVSIELTSTVLELKGKIEQNISVPASLQRLIYKGRVLKDDLTLENYEVQDGHTVHMVKSTPPSNSSGNSSGTTQQTNSKPTAAPSSSGTQASPLNPNNMAMFGSMLGAGANGMPDVNRMQDQLMRNPEMMQQIMSSPMMDNLLNNPDMTRNMLLNNPQMQSMLDANPQIRHALNDPAVLRQSMEMMRNPNAMREAMRSQDLAMSQLENLPGGFNALRRMYEEVQEPMMEASQNVAASAGSTSTNNGGNGGTTPAATAPTNSALPNPWGGGGGAGGPAGAAPGNSPFSPFGMSGMGGMPGMGGMGGGNPMGMDPSQMASMMQNPMMQQMMQQMLSDPNTLNQMAQMNPQLGAALQNPMMRSMLTNPEFIRQMTDPATMQRMAQMQQGMGGMPGLGGTPGFSPFGAPPAAGQNPGMGMGANPFMMNPFMNPFAMRPPVPAATAGLNFDNLLSGLGNNPPTAGAGNPAVNPAPNVAAVPTPPVNPVPVMDPAVRYASELQQLRDMGFSDEAANLAALTRTSGNVNAAVERLLGNV